MAQLAEAVRSMPQAAGAEKSRKIAASLGRQYAEAIEEPIVRDRSELQEPALNYPRKSKIFVPQKFKPSSILLAPRGLKMRPSGRRSRQGRDWRPFFFLI